MTSSISIIYGTTLMQDRLRDAGERRQAAAVQHTVTARERRRLTVRLPIALVPRA